MARKPKDPAEVAGAAPAAGNVPAAAPPAAPVAPPAAKAPAAPKAPKAAPPAPPAASRLSPFRASETVTVDGRLVAYEFLPGAKEVVLHFDGKPRDARTADPPLEKVVRINPAFTGRLVALGTTETWPLVKVKCEIVREATHDPAAPLLDDVVREDAVAVAEIAAAERARAESALDADDDSADD